MFPYTTDSSVCVPVSGISGASATVVNYHTWNDFVLTQSENITQLISTTQSGLPETINCNGQINFLSFDPSDYVSCALLRGGDHIVYGNQVMLASSHPMLVAWSELQAGRVEGYCSDSGKVSIYNSSALRAVEGNITSMAYDSASRLNILEFAGKSKFRLEASGGIPSFGDSESFEITAFPNPSSDGIFTISLASGKKISAGINITDQNGKCIQFWEIQIKPGVSFFKLDLSGLSSGEYLMDLSLGKRIRSLKLIRE